MPRVARFAASGAAGGLAAGFAVGLLDAALVLRATGAFWLRPLELLEPLAVYGIAGAVPGALLGIALALLHRRRAATVWTPFRLALGLGVAVGAATVAWFHVYDVVLPKHDRLQPEPYALAIAVALAAGALLFAAAGRLGRHKATSTGLRPALVAGFLVLAPAGLLITRAVEQRHERDGAPGAAPADAPDILLVVLDTTRADALSLYGNPRRTSPEIDAFARDGLVFRRAYAPGTWTSVSHASLFTGTYPSLHGTYSHQTALKGELPTLAEILGRAGYDTLFASQKNLLTRRAGWTRGYRTAVTLNVEDRVEPVYRRLDTPIARDQTRLLVELALRWLVAGEASPQPLFAFLNLTAPHTRYIPREPWYSEFVRGLDLDGLDPVALEHLASTQDRREETRAVSPQEAAALRARYDSEVAFMDAQLGPLLDWARAHARSRPLVTVITSDHGELLGEHAMLYHGKRPFEELIRIPLVVWTKPPGKIGESDELASLVDLLPTFARLAGVDLSAHPQLQGRSLLHDPPPPVVFSEHWTKERDLDGTRRTLSATKVAIDGDHKLVWESSGEAAFYVLRDDPRESRNLAESRAADVQRLEAELGRRFELKRETVVEEVLEEEKRRLEALGYLD